MVLVYHICNKTKSHIVDDRVVNYESVDSLEVPIRIINPVSKKKQVYSKKMDSNENLESTKQELQDAKARLELLEQKLAVLEGRIPQKYPDVEYLGYKDRKRILVCIIWLYKDWSSNFLTCLVVQWFAL